MRERERERWDGMRCLLLISSLFSRTFPIEISIFVRSSLIAPVPAQANLSIWLPFRKIGELRETKRTRRRWRGWAQLLPPVPEMFHRQKGKIKSLCPAFLRKSNSLPLEKEGKPHSIHRLVLLLLLALYSAASVFRLANSPIILHSDSGSYLIVFVDVFFYSKFSSQFVWELNLIAIFTSERFWDKDTFLESGRLASQKGEARSRLTPLFSSNQW